MYAGVEVVSVKTPDSFKKPDTSLQKPANPAMITSGKVVDFRYLLCQKAECYIYFGTSLKENCCIHFETEGVHYNIFNFTQHKVKYFFCWKSISVCAFKNNY